jgi:hypothetical protein
MARRHPMKAARGAKPAGFFHAPRRKTRLLRERCALSLSALK